MTTPSDSTPDRRVAYLACEDTIPGGRRRSDAFEHDWEFEALQPACWAAGVALETVPWEADEDWSRFDAVVIRTTWNYWDQLDRFLEALHRIEAAGTRLFNPAAVVEWNLRKTYLRALEDAGVPCIPTAWVDETDPTRIAAAVEDARRSLGADDVVVKRQVGAGAFGQDRFRSGQPVVWHEPNPVLVQPFQPAIVDEGEWSFVFVDGQLSHPLVKRAVPGDYRIQSMYGGVEHAIEPAADDVAAAEAVMAIAGAVLHAMGVATPLLYARVDMVRDDRTGQLQLMELEVVEPYLYPHQGPDLGPLLAGALRQRLG